MKITKKSIDSHILKETNKKVTRTITDFLNTEYKDYTKYVISTRAIPALLDGLKVGARKIMHAAFNGGMKGGKEVKNLNLVGDVYNLSVYLHGDASLHGTIFTLAAEFKDNLNPLTITGQHGSLRDEKAVSAPRYLYCKLSPWAKLYKVDEDLLEYVFDEGMYLEPVNYWPIIPTVLTSRAEGMAPGYKFSCFSYNPVDIIDACIECLNIDDVKETVIRPYVRGIDSSKFVFDEEINRWVNSGSYNVDIKNDIFQVTDLPYDMGYDKFEKKLNDLVEKGYLKDWKNYSQDDKLNYWLIFPKGVLSKEIKGDNKEKLFKKIGLYTSIPDDLLYVIDENGKLKHFADRYALLKYFVRVRLNKYNDRKDKLVTVMEKKFKDNSDICRFIDLVNKGELVVSNRKIKDIKVDLAKHELPDSVLGIQVSKLTEDEKKQLEKKNKEIEKELKYIKKTSIKDMYLNDLRELRVELEKEFV